MFERKSSFSLYYEVVKAAASSELVSSIVGVTTPREGLMSP